MWRIIRDNPRAAIFALLVHVLVIVLLVVSFNSEPTKPAVNPDVNIVKATVIDEAKIKREQQRKHDIERAKEKARQEKIRKQQEAKRKAEEKRKAELKKKHEAEKKRLALKKKQQEEAKRKKLAEQKRQAELKKKQEQERKRKEKEAAELALKKQLEDEARQRQEKQKQEQQQKEVEKYIGLIRQSIERQWRVPISARPEQECTVRVRLIPSGDVISVQVVKSSGNAALDRSVESAVHRASPLPVPPAESGLVNQFREIVFTFSPKNRN